MIAFGVSITEPEPYQRYAEPGIDFAAEPDSELFAFSAVGVIGRTYNLLLDAAGAREDLEALALVHPHAEIVDPDFCAKVRAAFADPDVGLVGSAGGAGIHSLAWWEGSVTAAPTTFQYEEHGGGEVPAFSWTRVGAAPAEVDALDGFLLVLSPWVVRNLRFDESLNWGHGYDVDFSLQVAAAGRKVMTADIRLARHHSLEVVSDLDAWVEAHIQLAQKWDGRLSGGEEEDWKHRARRAEAEREAARAIAYSNALGSDARVLELERALAEATGSLSWRVTRPLREFNLWRRRVAERRRRRR